jgi:predicted protein tyrosine phosphatase
VTTLPGPPTIVVLPRHKASKYLMSESRRRLVTCVVSIGEPGEKVPAGYGRVPRRLRLEFADIDWEGAGQLPATAHDIRRLIEFAGVVRAAGGTTLVHCEAGISRSTAAAYILHAVLLGTGQEREALQATLAAVPDGRPNRWMVRLADEALGSDGRLVQALEERFPSS